MVSLLLLAGSALAAPMTSDSPRVQSMTWLDLARAGDGRIVAVGDRGNVIYSDDEGESWETGRTPVDVMLTSVCFADGQKTGWAVGHDAVVLTTSDGGATWSQQYSDPLGGDEPEGGAGEEEEFSDDIYDDDIYSDDPYGEEAAFGPDTSGAPLLDIWCDTPEHIVAVGGFGYLLESTDGGASWEKRMSAIDNPDGWHLYAIEPVPDSEGTVMIAGERGTLFRSRDYGNSWERLESPYEGSYFGATAARGEAVLVYGLQGNVWLSRDRGESWQRIKTGVSRGINGGTVLPDGTILLVGSSGVLLTSHDGGSSLSLRYTAERETLSAVMPLKQGGVIAAGEEGLQIIRDLR